MMFMFSRFDFILKYTFYSQKNKFKLNISHFHDFSKVDQAIKTTPFGDIFAKLTIHNIRINQVCATRERAYIIVFTCMFLIHFMLRV